MTGAVAYVVFYLARWLTQLAWWFDSSTCARILVKEHLSEDDDDDEGVLEPRSCTREPPHVCGVNGPCNGYPRP